ncbi:hypothetical protein G6F32_016307 [Rhizopus arrhizus]|nr:hypothetical protein G6F32_016307 [Rhizopus arrhizus]
MPPNAHLPPRPHNCPPCRSPPISTAAPNHTAVGQRRHPPADRGPRAAEYGRCAGHRARHLGHAQRCQPLLVLGAGFRDRQLPVRWRGDAGAVAVEFRREQPGHGGV